MNEVGQNAIAVATEDIRIKVAAIEEALKAEEGEEAFGLLRALHEIADRTINRMIVERLIESKAP